MQETRPSAVRGYAIAVLTVVAAAGIRYTFSFVGGDYLPYLPFFAAIMAASWYGGFRPGLVATILSAAISTAMTLSPAVTSGPPSRVAPVIGLGMFVVVGGVIAFLCENLHETRGRLRVTLDSIGDAVIVTDRQGRVTSMNPVAEGLTGWSLRGAAGQPLDRVFRIVNEQTQEPAANPAVRALSEGVIVGLANSTLLIAKDGTQRPIDDSAAPVRDEDGRITGCVLVFRDVTARRRAEQALRESAQELTDLFENANVGIHWVGPDGIIQRVNRAELRMLGYAHDEYVGRPITDFHVDRPVIDEILRRLAAGEMIEGAPARMRARDGSIREVLISSSVRWDAQGRFLHTRAFTLDVTAERAGEQARALLAAVVASSDDAIVSKRLDGTILSWNAGAERIFGYTAAEAVGQPITLIVPPDRIEEEQKILERLRRGERIDHFETVRRTKAGRLFDISLTISPIRDAAGRIIGASNVARDISQRKRTEAELHEANRRKDEFLATLAHELRNPLAPIQNAFHLIRQAGPASKQIEAASGILERQLDQMVRLIDDLLDVSRISRGALELRLEPVDLASAVHRAVEASRPLIEAREQALAVELPPERVPLDGDLHRLAQVFANLLNNASKFTEPGGRISLTAWVTGEEVAVAVHDTGVGIPADKLGTIFELFTQVDRSLERTQGGLGIGLTLVQRIVEMHGGRVEAQSAGPGAGSEFTVRLPLGRERREEPKPQPAVQRAPAGGGRRVLVVDDNRDGAESLAMLLRAGGNEIHTAHDGLAALDAAERLRPDVILLDIGLPGLNGYDVCRRIRHTPWGAGISMIAVTGWGQDEDRKKSSEAGFDAHLVKPVKYAELMDLLAREARPGPGG